MKIAIVDDEKFFIDELKKVISEWSPGAHHEVFEYLSGEDIVRDFKENHINFDIIFMDITMGELSGLQAANILRELHYTNEIAFVTSHQDFEFARQSINVRPIGYFLKPMSCEDFGECIKRLSEEAVFTFSNNHNHYRIRYSDICFFKSKRNYIEIHMIHGNGELMTYRSTMADLCAGLPACFVRCHRSYAVNLAHIMRIEGNLMYMRDCEHPITIGDNFFKEVLLKAMNYR